jgi:hypothetical protein
MAAATHSTRQRWCSDESRTTIFTSGPKKKLFVGESCKVGEGEISGENMFSRPLMVRVPPVDLVRRPVLARVTRCLCSSGPWALFVVQVVGCAPPQSRPRYFWTHSETQVGLCCPHLSLRGRGDPIRSLTSLGEPRFSRSDSVCSAWSRPGHPRREASDSAVGRGDSYLHLDPPSATSTPTQMPGPVPLLRNIVLVPVFGL